MGSQSVCVRVCVVCVCLWQTFIPEIFRSYFCAFVHVPVLLFLDSVVFQSILDRFAIKPLVPEFDFTDFHCVGWCVFVCVTFAAASLSELISSRPSPL